MEKRKECFRRSLTVDIENTLWLDNPDMHPVAIQKKVAKLIARYGFSRTRLGVEQGYII